MMLTPVETRSNESGLVSRARAGSREAFDELMAELAPGLKMAALRLVGREHEADDLVQDALTAAFRGIGALRDARAWRRWVYQILVRRHYDRLMRRRLPVGGGEPVDPSDPLSHVLRGEARELARRALESLEEPMRTVLALRYLHELDLKSIERRTGRPLGTVKYLIHEGLRAFGRAVRERMR